MNRKHMLLAAVAITVAVGAADQAAAQLFGQRTLGTPLTRRPLLSGQSSSATPAPGTGQPGTGQGGNAGGTISGTARYLRSNRRAGSFVGGQTAAELGAAAAKTAPASPDMRSAIDNTLQLERTPDANLPAQAPPPAAGMYPPRLSIAAPAARESRTAFTHRVEQSIQKALARSGPSRVEVSLADDTAILRGAVASERERRLAELLMSFEPGVARVQNELQVTEAPPVPPKEIRESDQGKD